MSATPTEKIFSWILTLEESYPVEQWTINGVHIWPVLRNGLYTELWLNEWSKEKVQAASKENSSTPKKTIPATSKFKSVLFHIKGLCAFVQFYITPLKKSNALLSCYNYYKATYEGKVYNKFFDPLRLDFPEYKNAYIVNFGGQANDVNDTIHLNDFTYIQSLHNRISRRKKLEIKLERFDSFYEEIVNYSHHLKRFNLNFLREAFYSISKSAFIYSLLLKKTRAKEAIGVCYYEDSFELLGMNLAAYRLGIPSVDIQHGGQGAVHRAYARFQKLPASGQYEILPKRFWCWEGNSAAEIEKWASKPGSKHEVIVGGQPWLSFIKRRVKKQEGADYIVLYTLQPYDELMSPVVIECMQKLGSDFKWVIRLHPRMLDRTTQLKNIFIVNKLDAFIHPETFGQLTLPETLAMSSVHVCRTSGSIIEAVLMDIPNVIIDPVGVTMYEHWIAEGKATDATMMSAQEMAVFIRSLKSGK